MGISAIALLQLRTVDDDTSLRVKQLEDGLLLYTNASFASEPELLSRLVRDQIGDRLDREHTDPRGIFFIPDVAAPRARSYAGVIDEVAEGGVWGPLRAAALPEAAAGVAGLGALLAGVFEQLPPSVMQSVGDAARGQPGALEAASAQLRAAMSDGGDLSGLLGQLAGALGGAGTPAGLPDLASLERSLAGGDTSGLTNALSGSGLDMHSMQRFASQVESALATDPAGTADLVERLFGSADLLDPDSDEEDAGDEEPEAEAKPAGPKR